MMASNRPHPCRAPLRWQLREWPEGPALLPDALALEQIYWNLVTPEDLFLKENIYI